MKTYSASDIHDTQGRSQPSGIERFLVGVVFVAATGIFDPRLAPPLGIFKVNDLAIAVAAGVGVVILIAKLRESLQTIDIRSLVLILTFYGFAGFSLLWSESAGTGTARYTGFLLITLWTVYIASRFSLWEVMKILIYSLLFIAFVSALLAVAVPDIGTMDVFFHKGDWSGIYRQKNTLGRVMAVLIFVSLFGALFMGLVRLSITGLMVGFPILILTGSRTALAIMGIALVSIVLLAMRKRLWSIVIIVLAATFVVLSAVLVTVIEGDPLISVQGESLRVLQTVYTFTGRFSLWDIVIDAIEKRPWFGYGYDGFWKAKSLLILFVDGWAASDSHNGYMDTVLQTGFVGLAIFTVVYGVFMIRGWRRIRQPDVATENLFAILVLFVFLFTNLTESYLLKATSIFQLLFTYSLVLLSRLPETFSADRYKTGYSVESSPTAHGGYGHFRPLDQSEALNAIPVRMPAGYRLLRPRDVD